MADRIDLFDPTVLDELITRIGLPRQVFVYVSSDGSVSNAPGQLTTTGSLVGAGVYELTAPVGYTWFAAVGSGVASGAPRTVNCNRNNPGGRILRVYTFNEAGSPAGFEHNIMGLLVPA